MIGFLDAYDNSTDSGSFRKTYAPMAIAGLKEAFDEEIRIYKVALGEFPDSSEVCALWVVSGSPASAYDNENWLHSLEAFIQESHSKQNRLLGICFGHQMIAQALGGQVEKSDKGWGVGVRDIPVTETRNWMRPGAEQLQLIVSHQDQVVKEPAEATVLASTDFCPVEMYEIGNHILSIQGHPEFTVQFAKDRLNSRRDLVGESTYQTALKSYSTPATNKVAWSWVKNWYQTR